MKFIVTVVKREKTRWFRPDKYVQESEFAIDVPLEPGKPLFVGTIYDLATEKLESASFIQAHLLIKGWGYKKVASTMTILSDGHTMVIGSHECLPSIRITYQ